jgi:osmotically-inducible protein OsmY
VKRTMNIVAVLALAGAVGAGAACNREPAADNARAAGEAQADRLEDQADRTRESGDARADQSEKSAEAQADRLEQQADATRDAAERRADAIEDRAGTAGTAGREADRTGARVGASADAAKETADIKTALMAADDIPSMSIDVDTNAATKTVTLSGTVSTAAQKAKAESIAKREAPDYKINNQLKVSAAR